MWELIVVKVEGLAPLPTSRWLGNDEEKNDLPVEGHCQGEQERHVTNQLDTTQCYRAVVLKWGSHWGLRNRLLGPQSPRLNPPLPLLSQK